MDLQVFWAFAGQSWIVASIREPLLRWQDEKELDIIFLLFACWHPHRLPPRRWAFLQAGSRHWHERVTARIRKVRGRLKPLAWLDGYQACLNLELHAERAVSEWLCRMSAGPFSHTEPAPNVEQRLRRLFPELPPDELHALVEACALIPQQSAD